MDKKYEIVKKGIDSYTLKYKDKSFDFKKDLLLIEKVQAIPKIAKSNLIKDLAKDGMSYNDLTIVTKKDGKTYEDKTNQIELEKAYEDEAWNKVFDDVCKEFFGLGLANLLIDIGIVEDDVQTKNFAEELGNILFGKTPSGR